MENIIDAANSIFGGTVANDYETQDVSGNIITKDSLKDVPVDSGRVTIPVTKDVVLMIRDVKLKEVSNGALKKLDILWQVVDGIDSDGTFKNATFWNRPPFFDTFFVDVKVGENNKYVSEFWKSGKYKSAFKVLFNALDLDEFDMLNPKASMGGKKIVGTIAQEPNTTYNDATGEEETDGTFNNYVKHIKPYDA